MKGAVSLGSPIDKRTIARIEEKVKGVEAHYLALLSQNTLALTVPE
jgi:hypothetical protein